MMEAVQTSETSVNLQQSTQRYNPEDSHLHAVRRENLKSDENKFPIVVKSVITNPVIWSNTRHTLKSCTYVLSADLTAQPVTN
jgi:hypothetical protein